MKSVMKHQFSQVPRVNIPRSSFDRSHGYKTSFDAGQLIPIFVDEVLPGDTFNLKLNAFARMATPIYPIMDNMYMETFFFAVPIRLVWDNWQRFNGEQDSPGDSTDFLIPQMSAPATTGYDIGSLSDYFGIPTGVTNFDHCSFWHRAYNLIWNTWFRDQNLQNPVVVDKDDGPDDYLDYNIQPRGKRHDYFTSCLPWPQKSDQPVSIPLGETAPVISLSGRFDVDRPNGSTVSTQTDPSGNLTVPGSLNEQTFWPSDGYVADLENATAITINTIRNGFQVQKLFEHDARGGTRYTEIIRSHFGVTSPDARLQRPEYLGGGSAPIKFSQVASTVPTDLGTTPQGNLAAFAVAGINGHGFVKSFTEHCVIIGMVAVRADLTYQQGLARMFSRRTRFDFYWPVFSHLGEQAVLNKEIFISSDPVIDEAVFGYQERSAEYRYKPSLITGNMRSASPISLDAWHLSQDFANLPTLSAQFIVDNPPVDRVIATPDEPQFIFDSYIQLRCARPMPVYSVPGLIDHF